jgi:hypothetical protein
MAGLIVTDCCCDVLPRTSAFATVNGPRGCCPPHGTDIPPWIRLFMSPATGTSSHSNSSRVSGRFFVEFAFQGSLVLLEKRLNDCAVIPAIGKGRV